MQPIIVNEPRPKYIKLHINAAEREAAEGELLLRAGSIKYLGAVALGSLMVAFVMGGFWIADTLQLAMTGHH